MGDILKPYILTVDDDLLIQKIIERILTDGGYRVKCIQSAREGLKQVSAEKPALILVDIMMPEMDGYQFCASLQKKSETSYIPVIFLTALETPQSKTKAFSAGAVDYLVKPLDREVLLRKIRSHLETNTRWRDLSLSAGGIDEKMSPSKFAEFKKILLQKFRLPLTVEQKLASLQPSEIYSLSQEMVITSKQMAKEMAEFLRLPYLPRIGKDAFQLGVLPTGFCKTHFVVPIEGKQSKSAFVLSQPFNWELTDVLRKFVQSGSPLEILITERENIELLFQENAKEDLHDAQGDATIFQDKILRPQPMPIPQGGR